MSAKKYQSRGSTKPLRYRITTRLHELMTMAAMPLLFLSLAMAVRGQSALDGFDPRAGGTFLHVVVQPDGKILVGGDFTELSPNGGATVTRNRIARLNPDGTLDTAFNPNANGHIYSIAVQADGKILAGGIFTSIGGQTRNRIARLDATTGLADSFDPNANDLVNSIAVQADGKILAGGNFTSIGGQTRNRIARLDAGTGLSDSFNPNANGVVFSIVMQPDGKILAGGAFTNAGGQTRNRIARLDATTGLADSFNPNASQSVFAIALQADGKVLAGGDFFGVNSIGGQTRNRIARLDATTGLPDSFNPNASNSVYSIAVQADGKILAGGFFNGTNSIGGQTRNHIARVDPTTGLADSFDPNAGGFVGSIVVQADGKILVGGGFGGIGAQARFRIARLETDGRADRTLDLSIVAGFFDGVLATAVQPDGKVLISGRFTNVLGVTRNNMARLNTDGTLDMAFNPNANDYVRSIVVQADGKILAGGDFTSIGGHARVRIARLDAAGVADSFLPNANDQVYAIAVQADGKVLVGGVFTSVGGQPRNGIARLDATTGVADSFNPNPNATGGSIIDSIALQADGKILVGGFFETIGGQMRNSIARLDAATGLADSFNPNANGQVQVNSIAVQTDGRILAGGFFSNIGGQPRRNIARLDATTALADLFNPSANQVVYSIAAQADGKVLVGGEFNGANSIGGQARNHIARLDATTGLADSFNPDASGHVVSIAVLADGKIIAGGGFASMGGQPRSRIARLSNDTAAQQTLVVAQSTISWTRSGSSPQFTRVTFESSSDNVNYTALGNGTPAGNNWTLTGLSLPMGQNIYIRARGYYRSGQLNGSENIAESVRNAFLPRPATLGNISTRLQVGTDDRVMIAGFIVQGSAPKRVLIRAAGPSLTQLGVPNPLANPRLELHDANNTIGMSDNWQTTQIGGVITADQVAEIQNSGLAPSDPAESALIATLAPGTYTAIVQGVGGGTGVGIVEVYDLNAASGSLLANISTRGFVQSGDNVMIGGFIVVTQPTRVIIRAIGPSLSQFGVPDVLANPQLELHDANSTIARNDDWETTQLGGIITSDQVAAIQNSQLAPTNPAEAAIIVTLQPGIYTAIVGGVNNTTGNALVEVYNLP